MVFRKIFKVFFGRFPAYLRRFSEKVFAITRKISATGNRTRSFYGQARGKRFEELVQPLRPDVHFYENSKSSLRTLRKLLFENI